MVFSLLFLTSTVISFKIMKMRKSLYSGSFKYVVHLRCFSKFSDKSIPEVILNALPRNTHFATFINPRNLLENWNPYIVGCSVGNIFKPTDNQIFFVSSPDECWEESVGQLLEKASVIIFDLSESSKSLDVELEMIDDINLTNKTIFITEFNSDKIEDPNIIKYEKSNINAKHLIFLPLMGYSIYWTNLQIFNDFSEDRIGYIGGA